MTVAHTEREAIGWMLGGLGKLDSLERQLNHVLDVHAMEMAARDARIESLERENELLRRRSA